MRRGYTIMQAERRLEGVERRLQGARVAVEGAYVVEGERVERATVGLVPPHADNLAGEGVALEDVREHEGEGRGVSTWWRTEGCEGRGGSTWKTGPTWRRCVPVPSSVCSKGSAARQKKSSASGASAASVAASASPSTRRVAPSSGRPGRGGGCATQLKSWRPGQVQGGG